MIGLSSRDRVLVRTGEQSVYKRSNFGSPVGESQATALALSGPSGGDEDVVSSVFVVSANGSLGAADRTVTISISGVSGSLSVSSLVLSDASPNGTFTVTPATDGTMTLTVSSPGLTSASAVYNVVTPTPAPDMDLWVAWMDPSWEFGTARPNNGYGQQNEPGIVLEFDGSASRNNPSNQGLHVLGSQEMWAGPTVTITATEVQTGAVTPTFALIKRQQVSGKWRYLITMDKDEHWWSSTEKWRALLHTLNENGWSPAGTELWLATSFKFTSTDLKADPGGYDILMETHSGDGGLIKGGSIGLWMMGGNGNASAAYIDIKITLYDNPYWPGSNGRALNDGRYIVEPYWDVLVPGPLQTGIDHYLIFNYRTLCGYTDPVYGAIYGSLDTSQGFIRAWHAAGDSADPVQVLDYNGPSGTPQDPSSLQPSDIVGGTFARGETPKIGIYSRTNMQPASAGTQRIRDSRGWKSWRQQYGPAGQRLIDQHDVLAAFKAGA